MSKEYCFRCKQDQPTRSISHPSGTEWVCAICGWQVDFMHNEDEPDREDWEGNEPVGSCSWCDTNIYRDEDDGSGLCYQCQWAAKMGKASQ